MRVSNSSSWRIAPNSRPISASVSSVLVYCARVLEEPRVLDRHGDVRAELPQQRFVGLGELSRRVAQQVERANDAALPSQRHDELGERTGHGLDVARVFAHVVDEDWLAFPDGGAHETVPDLDAQRPGHLVGVTDRVRD